MCAPAATCGSTVPDACTVAAADALGCLVSRPRKNPRMAAPSASATAITMIDASTATREASCFGLPSRSTSVRSYGPRNPLSKSSDVRSAKTRLTASRLRARCGGPHDPAQPRHDRDRACRTRGSLRGLPGAPPRANRPLELPLALELAPTLLQEIRGHPNTWKVHRRLLIRTLAVNATEGTEGPVVGHRQSGRSCVVTADEPASSVRTTDRTPSAATAATSGTARYQPEKPASTTISANVNAAITRCRPFEDANGREQREHVDADEAGGRRADESVGAAEARDERAEQHDTRHRDQHQRAARDAAVRVAREHARQRAFEPERRDQLRRTGDVDVHRPHRQRDSQHCRRIAARRARSRPRSDPRAARASAAPDVTAIVAAPSPQ